MRTDKISNVIPALIVILVVLLSGCLSPVADVKAAPADMLTDLAEVSHEEKLFFEYDVIRQDMAESNVCYSMASLLRTEKTACSDGFKNRTYFTSILAVLFKIAMIPGIVMLFMWIAFAGSFDVLGRMLRFVHNSDGKKNDKILV